MLVLSLLLALIQVTSALPARPTPHPGHSDFPPDFNPENLLYFGEPVPLLRLRIRGADGSVLWEIERKASSPSVSSLRYGVVPPGFSLLTPVKGKPREFVPDENLAVLYVFPAQIICHRGTAVGKLGFLPGVWSSMPVNHPKNPAADRAFAEDSDCEPYGIPAKQ